MTKTRVKIPCSRFKPISSLNDHLLSEDKCVKCAHYSSRHCHREYLDTIDYIDYDLYWVIICIMLKLLKEDYITIK